MRRLPDDLRRVARAPFDAVGRSILLLALLADFGIWAMLAAVLR